MFPSATANPVTPSLPWRGRPQGPQDLPAILSTAHTASEASCLASLGDQEPWEPVLIPAGLGESAGGCQTSPVVLP